MNLLDKFSAVDIKAETRISNSDKQFCEVQQAAYNHGRNALKQILDISERFIKEQNDILGAIDREVYSNYIYDGRDGISLHSIHELLRKSHKTFISKIVSHFSSAYHVELDSSAVVDTLSPMSRVIPMRKTQRSIRSRLKTWMFRMTRCSIRFLSSLEASLSMIRQSMR